MYLPAELELTLDGIAQGGEGVGRWEDQVVFARGGLPGERVRLRIIERRNNYARGETLEILEHSPDRQEPRDPLATHMPWQHVAYPAQLRFKRQILVDQLSKIAGIRDAPVGETIASATPWGYRTTARLHSNGHIVGYHTADTQHIRPTTSDPLLHPALNRILGLYQWALELEPHDGKCEVLLRTSESDNYSIAALNGTGELGLTAMRWRATSPELAGVTIGPHPALAIGADTLTEDVAGLTYILRPSTFFQVNVAAAETLLSLVQAGLALQGGERVLDLFCGVGVFALPLAKLAGEVLGIEAGDGAVEDALDSAALNGISNVEFWAGHVEQALAEITSRIDAVVLDPPRRGCHPDALAELLRLQPARIVYVSCQPATLARDLRTLVEGGYSLEQTTPLDLFPQTPHIESVSVLHRAE